jgi:hypothetical protein
MLLKANSSISFFAVGALFFIELNNWNEFNNGRKFFSKTTLNITGFLVAMIISVMWYRWAINYNTFHGTEFLGTKSWPWWPLWKVSGDDFVTTLVSIFFNLDSLFNIVTSAIFFFSLIFILLNRRYLPDFLFGIFTLILIGTSLFFCYFFVGFRNQAYYYINLMTLPVFSFICLLYILKEKYIKVFESKIFKLMVLGVLLINIYQTGIEINESYYNNGWRHTQLSAVFYEDDFKEFINAKIAPDDKVISLPDETPNGTLYALNRSGWSNYGFLNSTLDSARINDFIDRGAKYLIIAEDSLLNNSILRSYTKKEVGSYKNVHIYNLK